jgi:hypothetical protein
VKSHKCKAGIDIDDARIKKYEPMCHYMVRKFLPALALFEASMDYEDLINQCRQEVFMALKNKFDPELAMTSTIKDPEKRKAQLAKKRANPEAALAQAEKSIVFGRLQNYLRRTRHKFHPDTILQRDVKAFRCPVCGRADKFKKSTLPKSGLGVVLPRCPKDRVEMKEEQVGSSCTVSLDMILEGINREGENHLFVAAAQPVDVQSRTDLDWLVGVVETEGPEKAKAMFLTLEKERQEAVVELLTMSDEEGTGEEESEPTQMAPEEEVS